MELLVALGESRVIRATEQDSKGLQGYSKLQKLFKNLYFGIYLL